MTYRKENKEQTHSITEKPEERSHVTKEDTNQEGTT